MALTERAVRPMDDPRYAGLFDAMKNPIDMERFHAIWDPIAPYAISADTPTANAYFTAMADHRDRFVKETEEARKANPLNLIVDRLEAAKAVRTTGNDNQFLTIKADEIRRFNQKLKSEWASYVAGRDASNPDLLAYFFGNERFPRELSLDYAHPNDNPLIMDGQIEASADLKQYLLEQLGFTQPNQPVADRVYEIAKNNDERPADIMPETGAMYNTRQYDNTAISASLTSPFFGRGLYARIIQSKSEPAKLNVELSLETNNLKHELKRETAIDIMARMLEIPLPNLAPEPLVEVKLAPGADPIQFLMDGIDRIRRGSSEREENMYLNAKMVELGQLRDKIRARWDEMNYGKRPTEHLALLKSLFEEYRGNQYARITFGEEESGDQLSWKHNPSPALKVKLLQEWGYLGKLNQETPRQRAGEMIMKLGATDKNERLDEQTRETITVFDSSPKVNHMAMILAQPDMPKGLFAIVFTGGNRGKTTFPDDVDLTLGFLDRGGFIAQGDGVKLMANIVGATIPETSTSAA